MCWEKHASSRSSIFRLHKNTLAPHLHEFLRHVLAVRAASDNHCLDRWDLQTDAVECVTKLRLRTHDFRKLFWFVHPADLADQRQQPNSFAAG